MGINLSSLVQTASGAFNRHRELQLEDEQRQRQRDMAILQQQLARAQITKLGERRPIALAPGAGLYSTEGKPIVQQPSAAHTAPPRLVDPVTGTIYERDPASGEWRPGTMAATSNAPIVGSTPSQHPTKPAQIHPRPQQPAVSTDAQGNVVLVNRETATSTPVAGAAKPLSTQERKATGGYNAAAAADAELTAIENRNPKALQEVARALSVPAIARMVPFLHGNAEEALTPLRGVGLSADANTYLKRLFDYASLVGPARYGRNFRSSILLQQVWNDFGAGQYGVTPEGIRATQRNRRNANAQLRSEAGRGVSDTAVPIDTAGPQPTINPRFDPRRP